jgi:hypothetical protein
VEQDTRALEREIVIEREELSDNLSELSQRARTMVDWRNHYRNYTALALAATFGTGVLIGVLVPWRSAARRRRNEPLTSRPAAARFTAETRPRDERPPQSAPRPRLRAWSSESRTGRQVSDVASTMFDALLGVASAKVIDLVSSFVPGFRDEYHTRRSRGHLA